MPESGLEVVPISITAPEVPVISVLQVNLPVSDLQLSLSVAPLQPVEPLVGKAVPKKDEAEA